MPEIIREVVVSRIDSAAGQQHEADAGGHGLTQPHFRVQIIQLFEKAAFLDTIQIREVVRDIVLDHHAGAAHQALGKAPIRLQFAKGVCQVLHDGALISLLHSPYGDRIAGTGVGVRQVEHISQPVLRIPVIHQQGDTLRALVDPSAETVPGVDFRASRSVGPLGVDEELLLEGVLVVVRCGRKKRHIATGAGYDIRSLSFRKLYHKLMLVRHRNHPFFMDLMLKDTLSPSSGSVNTISSFSSGAVPSSRLSVWTIVVMCLLKRATVSASSCRVCA